jgi:hypothetical protein
LERRGYWEFPNGAKINNCAAIRDPANSPSSYVELTHSVFCPTRTGHHRDLVSGIDLVTVLPNSIPRREIRLDQRLDLQERMPRAMGAGEWSAKAAERLDADLRPPIDLFADAVQLAVMGAAQRYRELITDL